MKDQIVAAFEPPEPTKALDEVKSESTLVGQDIQCERVNTHETPRFQKERNEVNEELIPSTWSQLNESLLNLEDSSPVKVPSQFTPLQITSTFKFDGITFK